MTSKLGINFLQFLPLTVWLEVRIKSCPNFPNNAQKGGKADFTLKVMLFHFSLENCQIFVRKFVAKKFHKSLNLNTLAVK